jgi:hypothetical protein
MSKGVWIHNVTKEIAKKAGLDAGNLDSLGWVEKKASEILGLPRCKREESENIGFYASRLIKHFGLDVNTLQSLTTATVVKKNRSVSKKTLSDTSGKYAGMHLGKFGAASEVRKIDPKSLDLSKYLEDKQD